ncbi:MAG: hypothetical protein RXS19_04595 [Caldisphaera sp.]
MDVVILNQSIIKQETMNQLDLIGENPNILIGCSGRISNFGGCHLLETRLEKNLLLLDHKKYLSLARKNTNKILLTRRLYCH